MPVALVNNRFLPRAQPNGGGAFPGFGGAPPAIASAGSAGVAATASRSDHTHAHGSQTDPTMHALTSAAGGDGFQPQSNRSAAVDPAAGDDSASGYAVGSYWINTSTDEAFVCVDDSVGAAVWESTTVGGSLQDSYDASAGGPPLVTLSAAIGPFAIRDNAAPLGMQLFSVEDSAGTSKFLQVLATEANIGEASTTSTGPGETQVRVNAGYDTMRFWPTDRRFTSNPGGLIRLDSANTYTYGFAPNSFAGMNLQSTLELEGNGSPFNQFLLFNNGLTVKSVSGTGIAFGPGQTFIAQPNIQADAASCSMSQNRDFLSQPRFAGIGGGSLTVTNWYGVQLLGTVDTGATVTTRRGVFVGTLLGAGAVGTHIGLDIANLAKGSTIRGIRSALSGATKRFIEHTGSSPSTFAGNVHMNDGVSMVLGSVSGSNVALSRPAAGVMRMIGQNGANNEGLDWNFQATANVVAVSSTTGAALRINNLLDVNNGVALGGGAPATLGTIGGAGPTAAAQAQWLRIDIGGVAHWIPVWT